MPAYCMGDFFDLTDPKKLMRYRKGVLDSVERYGGRFLIDGGRCDVMEGEWTPGYLVLLEFHSLEQAHRWYDSEEYRKLKAFRLAAVKGNVVFIEGTGFRG